MIIATAAAAPGAPRSCSSPAASRWPRWAARPCRRSRRARCWFAGTPRPGHRLPEMDRLTARAARELRALPGVTQVGGHVGRAVTADQIVGVNSGELWVTIGSGADYGRTLASIRNVMNGYPGLASHVEAFSTDKVKESLSRSLGRTTSTSALYGEELPVLERTAAKLATAIGPVDGVDARPRRPPGRGADDQGPGRSRGRGQVRAEARRRPPRRGDTALGHRRRQPVREAARVRRRRLGHAQGQERPHRASATS